MSRGASLDGVAILLAAAGRVVVFVLGHRVGVRADLLGVRVGVVMDPVLVLPAVHVAALVGAVRFLIAKRFVDLINF